MKRILIMTLAVLGAWTALAQPQMPPRGEGWAPERGPRFEMKDPAQMAQEETDRLDKLVNLTPKQYKKLYRFNKRQYNQMQNRMEDVRPVGRPEGMGPGGFGDRPEGMGPGGPGGPRGDGQFRRPPMGGDMQEIMNEFQQKKAKKYNRILTPDQYVKWESFEAQREFGRMRENPPQPK